MGLSLYFLLLFAGLVALWKSGQLSVRNAIGVSVAFGIEKFTVGFFIFAISTGLPEISSAVVSSIEKVPELSAGDLMGSSLVNMTLILGVALLIAKEIEIGEPLKKKLYQTIGLIIVIFIGLAFAHQENFLTGILLITIYVGAIFWFQAGIPKKEAAEEIKEVEEKAEEIEKKAILPPKVDALLRLFGSLVFLVISSWVTVHAGAKIAALMNVNLTVVGGVLIAVGTSFPELSLEINAIRQKEYELALGDIFGSSLLNVSLIMGLLTILNPTLDLSFAKQVLPFVLAVSIWVVQKFVRKHPLRAIDGWVCLGIFVLYVGWIFIQQLHA